MDILATLSGAQVLSSLDALSRFTQLQLHKEDIEKTAFRSHWGLFQFKRMPFRPRNWPSNFQRVIQSILAPYLWMFMLVYIDNILVYPNTFESHIEHLDEVLQAVEDNRLTLSPLKCHFFYSSFLLLRHKVSCLGLSMHKEKVQTILELKRPTKVSKLQSFLGMMVYFQAFIHSLQIEWDFYSNSCKKDQFGIGERSKNMPGIQEKELYRKHWF